MCASRFLLCTVVFLGVACGAGDQPNSPEALLVSAAVSVSDALSIVASEFEQSTGVPVALNLAGSDTLATQLTAGASVDVFVSADDRQMDRVERDGLILAHTRVDLLANQLVVIVPSVSGHTLTAADDLRSPRIRRIAMGDPESVPAGVYARQYLESTGLWEDVRSKVVPTRDVRAALAVVVAGNAEAGIVYRTDVRRAEGVRVSVEVPIDAGPRIRYPVAATATVGGRSQAAERFLAFLGGPVATAAFEDAGFIPLAGGHPEAGRPGSHTDETDDDR